MWEDWSWKDFIRNVSRIREGPLFALRRYGHFGICEWRQAYHSCGMEPPPLSQDLSRLDAWHSHVGLAEY